MPDQLPTPDDYRRAAALVLHRLRNDVEGGRAILDEAIELKRPAALIAALLNITVYAPGSVLPTDKGEEALQQIINDVIGGEGDEDDDENRD